MYLYLDTEFRSELDLSEVGHYKYLSHHSTELLMLAYAFGEEDVKLWQPRLGPMPEELKAGLEDDLQVIVAWNSGFERIAFREKFGLDIPVSRFEDPMIRSRYLSMPGSQDKVGKILDVEIKKLKEKVKGDESVISFFCLPASIGGKETLFGIEPTTYNDWNTHPRQWEMFCNRCVTDVEGMREILKRLSKFPLPDSEYELFELNEEVNDRGIFTDSMLLQGSMMIVDKEFEHLRKRFIEVTGLKNPRSNPQVLAWVRQHGYTFSSLNKQYVNRALKGECSLDKEAKEALSLRLQLSKSSVTKLIALRDAVEADGRVRGLFNFMGAARTGRWTSGLVQVQNLVKATKEVAKKQDLAVKLLKAGDYEGIKSNFTSPIDVACSALRPVFRAPKGKKFVIADLNAIESRGAGWVAGCPALLDIFLQGKDPYIFFAALMEGVAYEVIEAQVKGGDKTKRTNAKPPFLGCGYGLGVGEIKQDEDGNEVKTGLLGYGSSMGINLEAEYAAKAVQVYRNAYSEVVQFWYDLHRRFADIAEHGGVAEIGPLVLEKKGRVVALWLPSGRALHYIDPQVKWVERVSQRTGRPYKNAEISVEGIEQKTHQWSRIDTRGTKLFENVVQGLCRDILGYGMIQAKNMGFNIVLTCHDEIVAEVPENGDLDVDRLVQAMTVVPPWAEGFPLGAAGFETDYYRKDD